MKKLAFLFGLIVNSTILIGQDSRPATKMFVDFTPVSLARGEAVSESIENSPYAYEHTNKLTQQIELSVIREFEILGFGFGISTYSVDQKFSLNYFLPESGQNNSSHSSDYHFYRHRVGVHGLLSINQHDLHLGVRLGVYSTVLQNKCGEDVDVQYVLHNSQLGQKNATLIEKCYIDERALAMALTEFEILYQIVPRFWMGANITYSVWRNTADRRFLKFQLSEDLEWHQNNEPTPKINDILVVEPNLQVGICLRYDLVKH